MVLGLVEQAVQKAPCNISERFGRTGQKLNVGPSQNRARSGRRRGNISSSLLPLTGQEHGSAPSTSTMIASRITPRGEPRAT